MARFALIVAAALGFLLTLATSNLLLPLLGLFDPPRARGQDPQKAQPPGTRLPAWQPRAAGGRPAMGGLCFIMGTLIAIGVAWSGLYITEPGLFGSEGRVTAVLLLALCSAFVFAAIGFADDLICWRRGGTAGLVTWQRLGLESLAAVGCVAAFAAQGQLGAGFVLPLAGYLQPGPGILALWAALLVALCEGARFTDRTDGLCACSGFMAMLGLLSALALLGSVEMALLPAALAGALLAYLFWNFAPSRVLTGAAGSLFLAGVAGCVPLALGWPALAVLLGLPWLVQAGMVALQLLWRRVTGRALFAAAPLDRMLARRGWGDAGIAGIFCAAGLVAMYLALRFVRAC